MRLFSKKKEIPQERSLGMPFKEFFTPTEFSLQQAIEEIEHNVRTYYLAAKEEEISFLSQQVKKIYPFTKYFSANRGTENPVNLFDHTVRTVINFLKGYSPRTSPRMYQDGKIDYARANQYKWEEAFVATLVAIYHDTGKIFSQRLSFVGEDGFTYMYEHSFFAPPDLYFTEIEKETGVRFKTFTIEGRITSAYKLNHPMLSATFFARKLAPQEYQFLRDRFFEVLFFLYQHHALDSAILENNPAIKIFIEADKKASYTEVESERKTITQEKIEEVFEELRRKILSLSQFWNRQSTGIFTLHNYIFLTSTFIQNFDREHLAEYKGSSILGILRYLNVNFTSFRKGKILDNNGREVANIINGGILVPERMLFTEGEIATKIKRRYVFKSY